MSEMKVETIKGLIEKGVDPYVEDMNDQREFVKTVEMVNEHTVETRAYRGKTLLIKAIETYDIDCVKEVLSYQDKRIDEEKSEEEKCIETQKRLDDRVSALSVMVRIHYSALPRGVFMAHLIDLVVDDSPKGAKLISTYLSHQMKHGGICAYVDRMQVGCEDRALILKLLGKTYAVGIFIYSGGGYSLKENLDRAVHATLVRNDFESTDKLIALYKYDLAGVELCQAVTDLSIERVEKLLTLNPSFTSINEQPPVLMMAAQNPKSADSTQIIDLLLPAIKSCGKEVIDEIVKSRMKGREESIFDFAVGCRHVRLAEWLLQNSSYVNAMPKYSGTMIHLQDEVAEQFQKLFYLYGLTAKQPEGVQFSQDEIEGAAFFFQLRAYIDKKTKAVDPKETLASNWADCRFQWKKFFSPKQETKSDEDYAYHPQTQLNDARDLLSCTLKLGGYLSGEDHDRLTMKPSFHEPGSGLAKLFEQVKVRPNRQKLHEEIIKYTPLPTVITDLTLDYVDPPAPRM